ncbi:MAG: hypothetical protein M1429_03025 [Patescibacteria group bacterium]|nr:hypothetical protein [Patescibacteria group bacterium]
MSIEGGPGPDFLKQKYDLHNSPEVEKAARRSEIRTGEKIPQDTDSQIQNYLDRFKEVTERRNPEERDRLLSALKNILMDKFVTKYEEIPDSYWQFQEKVLRERGQAGDWSNATDEQKEVVKKETADALISDQEASLEQWVDYFSSEDSNYMPDYLKYWVFRSVINLAEYDKDKKEFSKRSRGTVKEFPDINQEALAYVSDAMQEKLAGKPHEFEYDIQPDEQQKFQQNLAHENFAKLYGWAMELINPIPEHLLPVTEGKWVKFEQGSDYKPLSQSIRGRGTGWCTAGENTAKKQLEGGDFYVYYSNDDEKNPVMPRIAIRMEEGKIAEVRGIAYKQNLDPYMNDVLMGKLEEFPDKNQYLKKDHDMQMLTEIESKIKTGDELTKDDLIFLYEVDSKIEGFGYQRDPRIEELRGKRDPKVDAPIVFECSPEEIAWSQTEIRNDTKAYVGPLFPGIFTKLSNFEHIYTSFPEGKIRQSELEIGGKTAAELENELKEKKININSYAKDMLHSPDFTTLANSEQIDLVRLKVRDLGFTQNPTTDQIYARAEELGLELCPAEVGPYQRLKDEDQPLGDYYSIAMKQITDRYGYPRVFDLYCIEGGLWLADSWARPADKWGPVRGLMFRLRKVSQEP